MIDLAALSTLSHARLTVVFLGHTGCWCAGITWTGGPMNGITANSDDPNRAVELVLERAARHPAGAKPVMRYKPLEELM